MFYKKVKKQWELGNISIGLSSDKSNEKVWLEAKGLTALLIPFLSTLEKSDLVKRAKRNVQVKQVDSLLVNLELENKPKFVVVIGRPASGKSLLGKTLVSVRDKCKLIELENVLGKKINVSNQINDLTITYIIDDPKFATECMWDSISEHLNNGGAVICLTQMISDLPESYRSKVATLDLH